MSNWTKIIWVALGLSTVAHAQEPPLPPCTLASYRAAAVPDVAKSWPIVARNAFDESGIAHPSLLISLLIAIESGGGASCLSAYLVDDLIRSPDGAITGRVVPTNRDHPVFFGDKIVVDPQMIIDWRYAESTNGPRYGDFQGRSLLNKTELEALGFSPDAMPPHWK
ncbi:hypothetical protein SLH49_10075 [Cognatiyoonia sp. IB215446]|uniref:hypothetical protein n=1 Tax=Cognatiyoonia sp. IB215446 TaxID=3097355 RepID=UPI002A0F4087|nr:hypothetical protein [Cognatiyoonia sp. IB215446]MDX8348333.1 hypothetical protein [Cognatiyoonia sp. IB215446]